MKIKTRTIAPKLSNKDIRLRNHHRLPESIKNGLIQIARSENESMSWVLEKVIIDYFSLRAPRYVDSKAERKRRNGRS